MAHSRAAAYQGSPPEKLCPSSLASTVQSMARVMGRLGEKAPPLVPCIRPRAQTPDTACSYQAPEGTSAKEGAGTDAGVSPVGTKDTDTVTAPAGMVKVYRPPPASLRESARPF